MKFQKILIVGAIVIGILSGLWVLICALLNEEISNTFELKDGYIFDYIIVGSGTAGTVLASLLSKHTNGSVLLIEAGGSFGLLSKFPLFTTFQQQGVNDWSFLSVPQQHSSKGLDKQQQSLPRGKGLGGSAQLNFMLHFDGIESDFNTWHQQHNLSNWQWKDILPFLKVASGKRDDLYEIPRDYSKLTEALYEAESEFSNKPWIFRFPLYNIKKGLRHSVFQRFLLPEMKNRNLHILSNTLVKKIFLKNNSTKAAAILVGTKNEHTRKEKVFKITVHRELLICAGAYQTPQLLLVSGIGDVQQLTKFKIQVQHHLPRVGLGLHDHINLPLFISLGVVGPTLNQRALLDPMNIFKYLTSGTGFYGNFGVVGHVNSYQDLPFSLTIFGAGAINEAALMSISNFKKTAFRALFPRYHNASQEGFVLISSCLQPKSRGSVTIAGENMRRNPLIDPNYLSAMTDINCTINAVRNAVQLVNSAAFAALRAKIHWPKLKECAKYGPFEKDFLHNKPSNEYLECLMRHIGLTSHHPGGSCAMGIDSTNSVVNSEFRVHGIPNLRVIDASVLPTPISGNPNTIIAAMALRAASWILADELRDNN